MTTTKRRHEKIVVVDVLYQLNILAARSLNPFLFGKNFDRQPLFDLDKLT